MNEFNILLGKYTVEADKELFFLNSKKKEDVLTKFPDEIEFPQLLKELGIFKSKSDARKNGWDKEIPEGYTDFRIGKLRTRISILKRTKPDPITEWLLDRIKEVKDKNPCKCMTELEEKLNNHWLEQENRMAQESTR